ncbi:MAG: 16S rRNA (guanine(966)-N(2))-methyltransferase RsmD [Candidatus Polarisedimenticolia bacterium]
MGGDCANPCPRPSTRPPPAANPQSTHEFAGHRTGAIGGSQESDRTAPRCILRVPYARSAIRGSPTSKWRASGPASPDAGPARGAPGRRSRAPVRGEGTMRLTGGEGRGRPLRGPRGTAVRPTADRVREALFDVLGARFEGSDFLDGFAGTGAVGIEALSRGARLVTFLEKDRLMLRLIATNLEVGEWQGEPEIVPGDVTHSVHILLDRGRRFEVIFLDPPYDRPAGPALLEAAAGLLASSGILVIEHRAAEPAEPGSALRAVRSYRHGDTALTTFARPEDDVGP